MGQLWVSNLVEAVHVELADKRGHIAVLEITSKGGCKLLAGKKSKGIHFRGISPPYEVQKLWIQKHLV